MQLHDLLRKTTTIDSKILKMGRFDIQNIYFKWGSLLMSRDHYESLGLSENYGKVRGSQ